MKIFLALFAALLHVTGYIFYAGQVLNSSSDPNPASWTIWAILATINALSYRKGVNSYIKAAQSFAGAFSAVVIWSISMYKGAFTSIGWLEYLVITFCFMAMLVWKQTGKATYANITIGIVLIISFIPTINGVLNGVSEQALPWFVWTAAYVVSITMVYKYRHEPHEISWKHMMFVPVSMLVMHGLVGVLA